jgi:hypothetical protein
MTAKANMQKAFTAAPTIKRNRRPQYWIAKMLTSEPQIAQALLMTLTAKASVNPMRAKK